jgi:hypothetical protein
MVATTSASLSAPPLARSSISRDLRLALRKRMASSLRGVGGGWGGGWRAGPRGGGGRGRGRGGGGRWEFKGCGRAGGAGGAQPADARLRPPYRAASLAFIAAFMSSLMRDTNWGGGCGAGGEGGRGRSAGPRGARRRRTRLCMRAPWARRRAPRAHGAPRGGGAAPRQQGPGPVACNRRPRRSLGPPPRRPRTARGARAARAAGAAPRRRAPRSAPPRPARRRAGRTRPVPSRCAGASVPGLRGYAGGPGTVEGRWRNLY